jgi:hypothetical protein
MIAAVAFTIQLAVESCHAPGPLRKLERELIDNIEALRKSRLEGALNQKMWKEHDRIIELRDKLLSKGNIRALPLTEQNLFHSCNIALGVVRCEPETRREARIRILRVLDGEEQVMEAIWGQSSPASQLRSPPDSPGNCPNHNKKEP